MDVSVGDRKVSVSNLDKVLWPEDGYTKGDLIEYYASMAEVLLPHLFDRPLSLVRFPRGISERGFYQKDAPNGMPDWVRIAPVWSKDKGSYVNFVLCNNIETLIWMANLGTIEINPWLSRYQNPDSPDFAVFDIDPSEGCNWSDVVAAAKLVKEFLDHCGLNGYPKVSGATGVHIYVPIQEKYDYTDSSSFVKFGATLVQQAYPDKITLERKVKDRQGKVYIDFPQNARGQTISSVYGLKGLKGAPVSIPVFWDELENIGPGSWNIETALKRVQETRDVFVEVLTRRQNISPVLQTALSGKTM